MLKSMRDSFHHLKWILLAVVAAFIVGFVYVDMGLGGANRQQTQDNTYAARVNGETISRREYERALQARLRYFEQYSRQPISQEQLQQMGFGKQVLDDLVEEHLLLQQADRLHLTASPAEVRQQILELPLLNPNGKFVGQEVYTNYLLSQGYTSPSEFEDELSRQITMRKMQSALANSLVVSPKAAEAEYRRVTENARVKYVLLPTMRAAANVTATPAEVEQYYKQNQSKYTHGEQRAIKYLVADISRIKQTIVPNDAELRKRYDASREQFKKAESAHVLHILVKADKTSTPEQVAAAKAKAESLVKQLRAGADFAKLAKENSQDPGSASNGGDMNWVERNGGTVKAFEDAVFTVPMNTISDPIRTEEFGFHIIKVTEKRPAGYRSFEEVRPQIAYQAADQMAKDQAREEITKISARLRQNKPKSPVEFSALANDKVSSNDTQYFAKGDAIPGLGNNAALSTWAFSANKGDIGDIIGTQRGPAIPYLYDVRAAGLSPFSDVKAKAEADARSAKARLVVKDELAKALPATNIDDLAKKLGVTTAETTVQRQGFISGFQGDTTAFVDAAMAAKVGELKGPVAVTEGAVAFQVLEQKKVDQKDLDQNKSQYAEMLRQQEAQSLRTVLVQRLKKSAKIVVNETVVAPPKTAEQAGM
jgi:peptidyl-prolyl cis-trans isomerase D